MKLLVVGPDYRDLTKVKNFTGVYAYYLMRELRKRGVEMDFIDGKHPDPIRQFVDLPYRKYDHALALGLRWFTHKPVGCAAILKAKVKGAVTQLHDGLIHQDLAAHLQGVDCTFTFRDDSLRTRDWFRYANTYHHIGWAADPDLLFPAQDKDVLRILIDHPYYKSGQPDLTQSVVNDTAMFAYSGAWNRKYRKVKVRRLVNGGAVDLNLDDLAVRQFDRGHIPYEEIAQEYRKTTVYMVTHKESVGLTCLELAYCGALVVAPAGLVYQDRLDTMRHILYEGGFCPWGTVLADIDPALSAREARDQTWDKVAERLLEWFGGRT